MNRLSAHLALRIALIGFMIPHSSSTPASAAEPGMAARGTVFHDRNGNGALDPDEKTLPGIRVSNGREVTATDQRGRWSLPIRNDATFFVIKPRGWTTPVDEDQIPRYFHAHKPNGSPKTRFPGVAPTGPIPASIDFPLSPRNEPNRFRVIFFADTQARDAREVEYIARDVVDEIAGSTDAAFGVTLGDNVFDDLSVIDPLKQVISTVGIPWRYVIGNHDENYDSPNDRLSDETFERHFGPSYNSFDYGPVHFIALDDVEWSGRTADDPGSYSAGLGFEQLLFLMNDLERVPKNQLVVLMMHIPINQVKDREFLYRLLEGRPNVVSISGHTHYQEHRFLGVENGWRGKQPHHHVVNATVCGSWWSGAPDERGIPHTVMPDGVPNGYTVFTFDGSRYKIEYRASSRPIDHQMSIHAPEEIPSAAAGKTEVLVNLFAGSERSRVEMRLGGGDWRRMERVPRVDPDYARIKEAEAGPAPPPGRKLPAARVTPHMWRGNLPDQPSTGRHRIEVRVTDPFLPAIRAARSILIR